MSGQPPARVELREGGMVFRFSKRNDAGRQAQADDVRAAADWAARLGVELRTWADRITAEEDADDGDAES